nr:hypothetical protein [Stenotrophomonas rhizophila]
MFKMLDPSLMLSSNHLLRKLLHSRPNSWIIFEILKLPLMWPVDFKMSNGANVKVLAELKRSTNPKLVAGYTKQLEAYKGAEGTTQAFYVVIDIRNLSSQKMSELSRTRSARLEAGLPASEICIVDGRPQRSASKR